MTPYVATCSSSRSPATARCRPPTAPGIAGLGGLTMSDETVGFDWEALIGQASGDAAAPRAVLSWSRRAVVDDVR
jgi:hypothetical protein